MSTVAAAISGRKARPFTYRTLGVFVDMGKHDAVATTVGIKWRGPLAWLLARSYHLAMMPGLKRKLRLLTDWNVQLIFGRDASEPGGRSVPPAQKARLLHPPIRPHLRRENRWDVDALGTPICQEDMIGGQIFFSLLVLDSLHRLGVRLGGSVLLAGGPG